MKTHLVQRTRSSQEGSTLLVALVIAAVLGLTLAAYMTYVGNQTQSINRSQHWNSSIPIVEAGIEEAMAHINHHSFGASLSNVMSRWEIDGWTAQNGEVRSPRRFLDGSYYDVRISTNRGGPMAPEIIGVGNALTFTYTNAQAAGVGSTAVMTTNVVPRQVRVRVEPLVISPFGLLARGSINLNGIISMDAFNSMGTNSFFGLYDERYHSAEGTIASIEGNINMGNGELYGTNLTSATGYATNGTVGDLAWVDGGNTGTQPDHYRNDLNRELDPVPEPTGTSYGWPDSNQIYTITNYATPTNVLTRITTDTYPTPPPPDGNVMTNTDGLVTTLYWPTNVDVTLIYTNSTYLTSTNRPTNVLASLIVTNPAATWYTNFSANVSTPPLYPQPPAINIITSTRRVTNEMIEPGPNAGTFVSGTVSGGPPYSQGNDVDKTRRVNGQWLYNYQYDRIMHYRYQLPISYTWPTNTYTYPTLSYTYNGPVTNTTILSRQWRWVLGSTPGGYYEMSTLTLSGQDAMLVNGNAVLWVTGPISMSGQAQIVIQPGASLTIYAGGNVDLQGQGVMNGTANALNFTLYGLDGCESIQMGGNAALIGEIYAPNAAFRAVGGGSDNFDIWGAISARTIDIVGNFQIHNDINLRYNGRIAGFVMTGWFEEKVGTP